MLLVFDHICKPGSVVDDHLSLLCVTAKLQSKIIDFASVPPMDICRANDPYTVLLRIGFTANPCYHASGWALTPPFHPYPAEPGGLFLLHFPGSRLRRMLSVILPCEARTFLTIIPFGAIPRDRPIWSLLLYTQNLGLSSAHIHFCVFLRIFLKNRLSNQYPEQISQILLQL